MKSGFKKNETDSQWAPPFETGPTEKGLPCVDVVFQIGLNKAINIAI